MDTRLKSLIAQGKEHYAKREFDKAEPVLREALAQGGETFADVHNMLAFILHDRGDRIGAEQHFRLAVEINPQYMEALLNLAVVCGELGKYEEAHRIYHRIRELEGREKIMDPLVRGKLANMHAELAQAYVEADCPSEAIDELRKAIRWCPNFADLHVKLGSIFKDHNKPEQAREHFATACTVNPKYVPARVLLGMTLFSLHQIDDAIAEWNAALAIEPENKNAQMYLRMAEAQRIGLSGRTLPAPASSQSPRAQNPLAQNPLAQNPLAQNHPKSTALPIPDRTPPVPTAPTFQVPRPPARTATGASAPAPSRPPAFLSYGPAPSPSPASTPDAKLPSLHADDDDPEDEPTLAIDRTSQIPEPS